MFLEKKMELIDVQKIDETRRKLGMSQETLKNYACISKRTLQIFLAD